MEQVWTPNEFLQQIKEELQILEGLIHSKNFQSEYLDTDNSLMELKETNRQIRAWMAQASSHNVGQDWVSANVARETSNQRRKGAQFGVTKFN